MKIQCDDSGTRIVVVQNSLFFFRSVGDREFRKLYHQNAIMASVVECPEKQQGLKAASKLQYIKNIFIVHPTLIRDNLSTHFVCVKIIPNVRL